jgi:hypothetical protein
LPHPNRCRNLFFSSFNPFTMHWLLYLGLLWLTGPGQQETARPLPHRIVAAAVHALPITDSLPRVTKPVKPPSLADTSKPIMYTLSPDLSVQTRVIGKDKCMAEVSFVYGTLVVYSMNVVQTAPVAATTEDIIVGSLQINKGATVTLRIPTPLQSGQIFLRIQYITLDHPLTNFSGMVASWSL